MTLGFMYKKSSTFIPYSLFNLPALDFIPALLMVFIKMLMTLRFYVNVYFHIRCLMSALAFIPDLLMVFIKILMTLRSYVKEI